MAKPLYWGFFMGYWVYVLRSLKDDSFYIGQTNNLGTRLARHNSGTEKYTRTKAPWEIMWSVELESRSEAMRLERKLKNMKSRKRILDFIEKS
ncbi:MAG: GIY-YIG nuclease family protein [Cyclobacteriaceae bacterium]